MNPNPLISEAGQTSPGILFFLPLLHVAWSDAVLTPSEIQIIDAVIQEQDWLAPEEKAFLRERLDPTNPPTPKQVKNWLKVIRHSAGELSHDSRASLVDLGVQLANLGTEDKPGIYKSGSAAEALHKIEEALGIISAEAVKEMLAEDRIVQPKPVPVETTLPGFDVLAMQDLLDGEHQPLKTKVRILLSDPVFSYEKTSPVKEVYREQVLEWCTYLADQGFGALAYPDAYGGEGDMGRYIAVFEMLGHHDLSLLVKFGVQFGLFGGSIQALGTEKHHQKYLPAIGKLTLPGCFAMTEEGHGSNVRDLKTTAVYDPGTQTFAIHTPEDSARKEYIGNAAAHGKLAVVFAQLQTQGDWYGVHAFIVRIRDEEGNVVPGVRIDDCGEKLGLNGVDNGRIWFDQVRIPRENMLDRFASVSEEGIYSSSITSEARRFFTMLGTLVGGRICVPIAGLSASKSALAIAIRYGELRRQFGPAGEPEVPILNYPTHQRRLMPLLANAYALHFAHVYAVERFLKRTEADAQEVEALAAGLKAVSTWNTTATIQECREACGGNGYLAINRFGDMKADTEIFTTFEGDNTVLMQLVAKSRLSEFKREFGSMNFLGMVNFIAQEAAAVLKDKNPLAVRSTDRDRLMDPDFYLNLFRRREESLVMTSARRIKHRIDNGMEAYTAFMEVQTHFVTMAHAYVDRVILEQFVKAVQACEQEDLQAVLHRLCGLYALHSIETNRAWYLQYGYMSGAMASAIRKLVDKLCLEVRREASGLVKAFGIPDVLLAAPIAGI